MKPNHLDKTFVTGGTGMLGSHLMLRLLQKGYSVRALKRENSDLSLISRIFHYYDADQFLNQIEWFDGDVLNPKELELAMKDCKQLFHCAAMVSFQPDAHKTMLKINVEGTKNVMDVAFRLKIEKVVHVSSIASFGRANETGFVDENCFWTDDTQCSCYSLSKYKSEQIVWNYIKKGLNAVIVNPSVIIGAGNWTKGSSELITAVFRNLKFYTSGINGYIDVRDVANIMIILMESPISGERFILNSENLNYKELFTCIANGLHQKPPFIYVNKIMGEIAWRILKFQSKFTGKKPLITRETARTAQKKYEYSNRKILETIDYQFITMEKSLQETCSFFLKDLQTVSKT